jgi:glutathione S-transferase
VSDLILHHYNESPYAEKIRCLLGYKGLAWRSVIVPRIAPKPDLVALTGGYRKVPVLQIGADVYCDTRLIADIIEELAPQPNSLNKAGTASSIIEHWVDLNLFGRAVAYTFGRNVDRLPDVFLADRAALRGAPLDREALKLAVPLAEQELATQLQWIEQALQGHDFVNGDTPGTGDFTLYATLWFAQNGQFDFTPFVNIGAWLARMKAFGHGQPTEMTAVDALALASQMQPVALPIHKAAPDPSGVIIGQLLKITPEQLGHGTSVQGELIAINAARMTLLVLSERCGALHVHFPRVGYRITPVQAA